jgi:hypothetical protein
MGDVIELHSNEPDADCVCVGPTDGLPYYKFGVKFTDGEREYTFQIWARDKQHAEQCVHSIRNTAELCGQILAEIPA